ncbi:hypothetical protein ABWU93_11475 [Xanthomonas translucens pv. translucens]|uniref:hypothetical protein n=1 Tax=Xanthomonas campestris pv. translucens TaxID=343 RepID=UPI003F72F01F
MIIQLDFGVSDEAEARVRKYLDHVQMHDSWYNSAEFQLCRGDGTCVVESNQAEARDEARIFQGVMEEIEDPDV